MDSSFDPVALAGLIGLLFVKEAGVPVPIPGDLLVLGAGIAGAGAGAAAPALLAAILLAGYSGGSLQFLVVRGTLRDRFLRALARLGVAPGRLDALADWLRRRGALGVAVARATPGVRIGAIAASGLAALPYRGAFLPGLVVGNGLFVGGHFALGYVVGPPALAAVSSAGSGTVIVAVALLIAAACGALVWRLLRLRAADRAGASLSPLPGYGAWAEAACPACLVITLMSGR
jgi:membrane protein DedA with SNARE-associated domain